MKTIYRKFEFKTWTEFSAFIEENKGKVIGKAIDGFYCNCMLTKNYLFSDEPIVFVVGDMCICILYYSLSSITLYTFSRKDCGMDVPSDFLFENAPEDDGPRYYIPPCDDLPLCGVPISDITLRKFSHEFEINASTGETRPDGGDYFSTIVCDMENGKILCIRAEDAMFDGYVDIWVE